jgi:outer membrane protein assembly factor BamB
MNTSDLVYIGIHGSVVALDRASGDIVWSNHLRSSEFVNVLVDGDRVFATTYGEAFCLDAHSGQTVWHNRLKGFGLGLATIATADSFRAGVAAVLAEKRRADQAAASASAAAAS